MASPYRWVFTLRLLRDYGVRQCRKYDHTFVARLQPARRLVTQADAGGRARGYDVTRFEGHDTRKIRDQVRDAEDQFAGVRVVAGLRR